LEPTLNKIQEQPSDLQEQALEDKSNTRQGCFSSRADC
jgi:hypothetical protein